MGGNNSSVSLILEETNENFDIDDMDGRKLSRAEWLMAQVDLDPIESLGSQELSSNFKTLNKKLRAGQNTNGLESSGITSLGSGIPILPGGTNSN